MAKNYPISLKTYFSRKCPKCGQMGSFQPEMLFRRCLTTEELQAISSNHSAMNKNYVSESVDFLADELASPTNKPEINQLVKQRYAERIEVLFASVCPNTACQSPVFLRIAGPRGVFAEIVRGRKGLPQPKLERDLRLIDPDEVQLIESDHFPETGLKRSLFLVDTLPETNGRDAVPGWCTTELGKEVCTALMELAPGKLGSAGLGVRSKCLFLLEEMLSKLERKVIFELEVRRAFKRKQAKFTFLHDALRRLFGPKLPIKAVVSEARFLAERCENLEMALDTFFFGAPLDPNIDVLGSDGRKSFENAMGALEVSMRKGRMANGARFVALPDRIKDIYQQGLLPREVWRWAVQIASSAKDVSDNAFCEGVAPQELAVFVRIVALRGFQHPYESVAQMRSKAELTPLPIIPAGPTPMQLAS